MKATTELRNLLKEPGMLVAPGCVDAISGLVNKHFGFKAIYTTGSGMEAVMLGHPDMGLKTLTETTVHVGHIVEATGIPLISDGEAGFGSYINMIRAVKEFEKAGVAGIHVEDQTTPPVAPTIKTRSLLTRDQAVGMLKAALDARTDPDFVIIARTDADEISVDEVIERCNLFMEAGADLVMPLIIKVNGRNRRDVSTEELLEVHRRICREIPGPKLGLALPPEVTIKEIEALGYKIYLHTTDSLQAATAAMFEVMGELQKTGSTKGYFDRHPRLDPATYAGLLRTSEWVELDKKYVPSGAGAGPRA